ncbi:MAG: DMT family transporter [Alistipes sp.]
MDKGVIKGHAALWVANIIWGLNAPIAKMVLSSGEVQVFAMNVYRMAGACLLFWTASLFVKSEHVPTKDLLKLFFASFFGIQINQMLFLWGLSLTSPIDTSIIATVVPVLTMILATIFLREPLTWLKATGVFLGAAGAIILVSVSQHSGGSSSLFGDILAIVSAISYAVYLTAFRDISVKYTPLTTMKWMFLFAAVTACIVYFKPLTTTDYTAISPKTYAGIGYIVIFSTFLAYLLVPIGQKHLRPTLVSMYSYLQPLVAVLFTIVLGLDLFGYTQAAAAACIFFGVWVVSKSKSRAQLEQEQK